MSKELLKDLRDKRKNYREMIDFCCDCMILNNHIITSSNGYWDVYCGEIDYYDEENDYYEYVEIYQYYVISERDAERLAEYTNEIVYYNDVLDVYLLGVTHYGTSWDYVPSNWKTIKDYEKECE